MFVQNNAGRLLAQGGMEAARYKMAEGQAYAGMLQQMGGTFSKAIEEHQFKKQKKERDAMAARTLGEMFGMEEKDALAVTQSVGAENVANFAMAQERLKASQRDAQAAAERAKVDASVGSYLEMAINDPNANQAVRSLAELNQNGIPVSPEQLKKAVMMKPEQPWQPSVVDLGGGEKAMMTGPNSAQRITPKPPEKPWQPSVVDLGGGEQALMTSPSSAQRITPQKAEKPKGVALTDKVNVKIPQVYDNGNGDPVLDYENAPSRVTTVQDAALDEVPGYEVYLPEVFEKTQPEVMKVLKKMDDGVMTPQAAKAEIVKKYFRGNEKIFRKFMNWAGL